MIGKVVTKWKEKVKVQYFYSNIEKKMFVQNQI